MLRILSVLVLVSASAQAEDYRDCKELYVYATASSFGEKKPSGQPWDNGSGPDPQLTVKPSGRADLAPKAIGPKIQDSESKVTWDSVWPDESKSGVWLPIRVGDSLDVWLSDLDALADDPIGSGKFEIPKDFANTGFMIAPVNLKGAAAFIGISATDGKRMCAGVDGDVGQVKIKIPPKVVARPDGAAFNAVKAHNKCNLNGNTPACRAEAYVSVFDDVNNDGESDVVVIGGPFVAGSKTKIVALWLGSDPAKRKELFVGDCDEIGMLSKTEFTCTADGKTSVISYSGGGAVRQASEKEVARSQNVTAFERAREAQTNLKSMFVSEKSFYGEKDHYSVNLREIGFSPPRGNFYSYFAAPRGAIEKRTTADLVPAIEVSIIAADEHAHPGLAVATGLKEAGCPLTFGTSADGEPIGLGVTGEAPKQEFIAYAIGNVDDDPDFDCWSIATFERKTKSGKVVPAGEPLHEKSDYDEKDGKALAKDQP